MISLLRNLHPTLRRAAAAVALLFAVAGPVAAADAVPPLVSTDWLKGRLGDPNLLVLDIRSAVDGGGAEAYRKGHIPGAVHSDYSRDGWRAERDGVPLMLPTTAQLEALIGGLGIDADVHVVVMPAGVHATDFGSAARVYWTLKAVGHRRVSILDGGFAAWTADPSNPIETGERRPTPRVFTAVPDPALVAEIGEVEAVTRSGGATLIDARPPDFYLGKVKAPRVAAHGHIPGAVNIDNTLLYDAGSNRLKSREELATLLAAVPEGPVMTYCNTGHWAATNWFVLSEILRRKDVKLYYGSMIQWAASASRPVASARTRWDDLKQVLGIGQ
jgi:thiosulfate/3-mercaptopyruvate sulfurtransferase